MPESGQRRSQARVALLWNRMLVLERFFPKRGAASGPSVGQQMIWPVMARWEMPSDSLIMVPWGMTMVMLKIEFEIQYTAQTMDGDNPDLQAIESIVVECFEREN